MSRRESIHYVNNKQFSQAVVDYVKKADAARAANEEVPIIPNYIAECFLRIAEGLSYKQNFIRYTYREEMVMDAVENCLKAIGNYDVEAATRTGNPNAFAYFTQISWYAFLRRIAKEKKQFDVKQKFLSESGIDAFISSDNMDVETTAAVANFVDELRDRIDKVKEVDREVKVYAKKERLRRKRVVEADSDLTAFFGDVEDDT